MPPTKRTAAAGPAASPATGTPESTPPGTGTSAAREPNELRLHLPFLTVTLTRPASGREHHPRPAAGTKPAATPEPDPQSGQRLLFYAGVAALGVAGIVDWPVAAAIATGTWIAARARSGGEQISSRPALPAGGESTGTS